MAQPMLHLPQRPPPAAGADDAVACSSSSRPVADSHNMARSSSGLTPSGSRSAPPAPLATFLPWSPVAPSDFPTPSFEHQQSPLPPPQSQGMSPTTSFAPPSPSARTSLNVSQYSAGSVSSSHSFRTLNELPSPPPSRSGRGSFAAASGASPLLRLSPSTSFTTLPPPLTQLSLPLSASDHRRTDSMLSNASSTRTSSFFAQRVSVPPPAPPPPPGALEPGKALARAGSVGRAGLDSATVARLGVGLPGGSGSNGSGGGRRADHPRSASDASSGPRPVPLVGASSSAQMRETWAHKPYFAFERDQQAARAVSGPVTPRSGRVAGLPPSSSPPGQHAGLPHSQLARTVASVGASSVPEPTAGEILEEEEKLELDREGREVDGRRKRKRRRWRLEGAVVGRGAFSSVWGARELADGQDEPVKRSGVVAVKMMSKEACRENDRTFTSFAREVSILKRLSHPAIIPHLTSFTTPTHHCVVLPLIRGGELFVVIEDPARWERIGRGWVKRVWRELEAGVAYLHTAGVVHRDIKLENILLTRPFPPTSSGPLGRSDLPLISEPLIQLTDFGLAKEVGPADPPLTTRCGSDSYAAPEIIMGREYDGRKTDSWACGVVLFALLTRALPFGSPPVDDPSLESSASRRARMLRIAKGDYTWPSPPASASTSASAADLPAVVALAAADGPSPGSPRLVNESARRLVDRLLTREPQKRGVVGALGSNESWGEREEADDWPAASGGR